MSKATQHVVSTSRLTPSLQFRNYLYEPHFGFASGGKKYSRSDIARLTESPCLRAAANLFRTMERYRIASPAGLYAAGLDGLLRCQGIGERAAYVAAVLLYVEGYNVEKWAMLGRRVRTVKSAIRLVHSRTRKQKH